MTEGVLCLVCVIMVGWILLLMSENHGVKSDITKLKHQLRHHLNDPLRQVTIGQGRKLTKSEIGRVNQSSRRY